MIKFAPWSQDEVDSLSERQLDRAYHPYTCGLCGVALVPQKDGWVCARDGCPYTQNWAHYIDMKRRK